MNDVFLSSDSKRSKGPLQHVRQIVFDTPMQLALGGELPCATVAYETYGTLSDARDNAVLICHALSGDSHVARHDEQDDPGWWDVMVGPGKPIDTERFFVICSNTLGGCRGTTGPDSIDPRSGQRYASDFPVVTVDDMVDLQQMLIERLGIDRLLAVAGGSLGGHQALSWATRYPDRIGACVALATSPHLTSQALAFDVIGRNAIVRDPHFNGGRYHDAPQGPNTGLAIARMLGHITYLSREAMAAKFHADKHQPRDIATEFEKKFSVGTYLAHKGHEFAQWFDPNSYVTISMAMDLFELGRSEAQIKSALAQASCRWLVISFSSDWLFPPAQSRQIVDALLADTQTVSYCNVQSNCGHDAFLLPDDIDCYGEITRAFLRTELGDAETHELDASDSAVADAPAHPTSIFGAKRLDYDLLSELIEPDASVLDVGCGRGGLLKRLTQRGHRYLVGVELDEQAILTCLRRGLDVIQADLNEGLPDFADRQFDCVVLSQTLQSIVRTEAVVDAVLRVGRRCIISFPNFAHRRIRQALHEQGRSPVTESGPLSHAWYNTPNRRFLSVLDWQEFCTARGITVHREVFLDTEAGTQVSADPNLNADVAIFVISR
jgi:homoserine O-acetyltransferase